MLYKASHVRKISHLSGSEFQEIHYTNSFISVWLRQQSQQGGMAHSPCALFPFRGLQLGIYDAHCPKHRKRQLFSNEHLVSPWAFLCVNTSSTGVVCHAAFSPASEGFLLLPPFPGSDGFSSITFKPWVAWSACLALGSDFCLCLVVEIRFTAFSSLPWPGRFWLVRQAVMMVIMQVHCCTLDLFLQTLPFQWTAKYFPHPLKSTFFTRVIVAYIPIWFLYVQ